MKKKLIGGLVVSSMMLGFSITAMASDSVNAQAWDSFSVKLPADRGDVEVSTVAKSSSTDYFTIDITSMSSGSSVCAWTESRVTGNNYSDPARQIDVSAGNTNVSYYDSPSPSPGDDVVLNLDNPIFTSSTPTVSGEWTPN